MNISTPSSAMAENLAMIFRLLAQPSRLQILLVIGAGEACVCHLEAALRQRQAYISQQLMLLRDAGLVTTNRDGRNIYYRLSNPGVLAIIDHAALAIGAALPQTSQGKTPPIANCPCPHCVEMAGGDANAERKEN
jgi:DNA-binding transcriptional ArsR family regulator